MSARPLPRQAQIDLCLRAQQGDRRARNRLIETTEGLVWKIVRHIDPNGRYERDDLIQAGRLGVDRAIDLFDPARGVIFATYAANWITARVRREIADVRSTVYVPYLSEKSQRHGEAARNALREPLYLDAPVHEDSLESHLDQWASGEPGPEDLAREARSKATVRRWVSCLSPRERRLMEMRHLDGEALLDEIAPEFGVTRERVRQIEMKAMEKLGRIAANDTRAMELLDVG